VLTVALLGPLRVTLGGNEVPLKAPQQRALLACLALERGFAATTEHLVDALWVDPPARAVNIVQQHVSGLRRALGAEWLVTVGKAYRLDLQAQCFDVSQFRHLLKRAEQARRHGDLPHAADLANEALDLDRGEPLADLPDVPFLEPARAGLKEAVLAARVFSVALANDLGRYSSALEHADVLATGHPLHEDPVVELMRALVGLGRQADALAAFERTRRRLDEELGVQPGPRLREAHLAVLQQDQKFAPVPETALDWGWLPDTVPNPPTELLGRTRELEEVEQTLRGPGVRLVTVLGTGGVGKTRLAIEVARRARGRPVAFVPLDRLASPTQVLPAIAAALRVKESAESELVACVARAVGRTELLLVLDNVEHVIDAAPDVAQLISHTSSSFQVFVTSREALHIQGEYLLRLEPLSLNDGEGATQGGLAEPSMSPAEKLFRQRARQASPSTRLDDDQGAIRAICLQLDGLPLAIELAASRVALLPPAALLDRLEQDIDSLATGPRDSPRRQHSLRACLEWSVSLLAEDERRLLACLSVFTGGAAFAAAEAVSRATLAEELRTRPVLDVITSLVDKSLITVSAGPAGPRLGMLQTIRAYAADLLAPADRSAALRAHALYFHDLLARDADLLPWPPRNVVEAAWWNSEVPNARVAMSTLGELGRFDLQAALCVALVRTFNMSGALSEATGHVVPLLERNDLSIPRRVDLLLSAALIALQQVDHAATERLLREASELLSQYPDPLQETYLHVGAAWLAFNSGDQETLLEALRQSDTASRRSQDAELIAVVGACQLLGGYAPAAIAAGERALITARQRDNQVLERMLLVNLSEAALAASASEDLARGLAWGTQGYQVSMLLGDVDSAAISSGNAGAAALLTGDDQSARRDLRRSLRLARRTGNVYVEVEDLLRLGAVEAVQGNAPRAATLFVLAEELNAQYALGVLEANRRIIETFLSGPALSELAAAVPGGMPLEWAVEYALEEDLSSTPV
jgi:predicted ATPase/DNA-binding SARP family transcriptional activator